jgi:exosortase D (VPLPA-CTERM-specific)
LCWEKLRGRKKNTGASTPLSHWEFKNFSWNAWGIAAVFLSLFLMIMGEAGSVETLLYIGIWGGFLGIVFVLFGRRILHFGFPLLILLFIVPLPASINRILTFQLKLVASALSTALLRLCGVSVVREGNILDMGISQIQVVDACSGLRYVMPFFLMALIVGYIFGKSMSAKTILCLSVIPLSIIVNSIRIWITGLLTVHGLQSLAQDFFHSFSGLTVFLFGGAILVAAALGIKKIEQRTENRDWKADERSDLEKTEYFLSEPHKSPSFQNGRDMDDTSCRRGFIKAAIIVAFLFFAFSVSGSTLRHLPAAHNVPERRSFKSFPMHIAQWEGKRYEIPKKILDELWSDDYISATYRSQSSENHIHLFIPFYEYQNTRHTVHTPQACMIGGGWAPFDVYEGDIVLEPADNIKIAAKMWRKGNLKLMSSYFFLQRGRVITSPLENKFYLMWDGLTKRRTDGALVRVELMVAPGQSNESAHMELKQFLVNLWPVLHDYVPG